MSRQQRCKCQFFFFISSKKRENANLLIFGRDPRVALFLQARYHEYSTLSRLAASCPPRYLLSTTQLHDTRGGHHANMPQATRPPGHHATRHQATIPPGTMPSGTWPPNHQATRPPGTRSRRHNGDFLLLRRDPNSNLESNTLTRRD